jgi:hypothetical protein
MNEPELKKPTPIKFLAELARGMMSVLTVTNPPLYRYPYRSSAEAFRGDFKRIAEDMAEAFHALEIHEEPK